VFPHQDDHAFSLTDERFERVPQGGPDLTADQARAHYYFAPRSGSADERSRDQPSSRQRQKGWPAGSKSTRTWSCGW
jgi:hypothetical protein